MLQMVRHGMDAPRSLPLVSLLSAHLEVEIEHLGCGEGQGFSLVCESGELQCVRVFGRCGTRKLCCRIPDQNVCVVMRIAAATWLTGVRPVETEVTSNTLGLKLIRMSCRDPTEVIFAKARCRDC